MKLLDNPTSYDKILRYLEDPLADTHGLTDHELELAKRYQDAYVMYRDCKSRTDAAAKLMKIHGISRAQAYRSVATAISLFGDAAKLTVDGARHLVSEILLEGINIARATGKPGIMIIGAAKLGKAWNIENPVEEALKEMQPHTYILNLDPQSLLAFSKMINKGTINFDDFINNLPIQDADFSEIKTEPDRSGAEKDNT